jgi:hypothetical protein
MALYDGAMAKQFSFPPDKIKVLFLEGIHPAAAERMKQLGAQGFSVCALDSCATTLYLLAGVAPYGDSFDEFAAVVTSKQQTKKLVDTISRKGPDVIVLNRATFPWPRALASEAWQACRDSLFDHYRRGEEHGYFEFWHRKDTPKSE